MDKNEFEIKVVALRPNIYSMALKICANEYDAEEVAQDTLLKLWSLRHKLNDYTSISAIAIVIGRNEAINRLRKRPYPTQPIEDANHIYDETFDADNKILNDEADVEIDQILSRLPQAQQIVLKMRHIDGFTLEEIASLTGTSNSNVRVLLSRARQRVKNIFLETQKQTNFPI